MIRHCVCVIAAMASFSVKGAIGQAPAGASLGYFADQPSQKAEAAAKNPDPGLPPRGDNPLWGIPMSSLSVTRRVPAPSGAPMPVAEDPPPQPAEPERPPLALVGTAIGKPQNVALILNQTTRSLVRLHVGDAAAGW